MEKTTDNIDDVVAVDNNNISSAMKYANELKEDLNLTLQNLRDKALTTSSMKAKWVGYLAAEKETLQKLITIKSNYQRTILNGNKNSGNAFDKIKAANQEDELMRKIDSTRKNVELSLEVINQAIVAMTEFSYNIKNAIDVIKLNN